MKAVVFVDVQKDFIDGALRNEKAIEVTPRIVEFAKECVEKGYTLYATRDTHEKTTYIEVDKPGEISNFTYEKLNPTGPQSHSPIPVSGYFTTLEGQKLPVEHCIEGTDGWMIDERLWNVIEGKVTVVNKSTFGSFDLAKVIEEDTQRDSNRLDEIVICGYVTSICVIANAIILRAKFPNAKITVMKDLCAGVTEVKHNAALETMQSCQIDIA